jgi:hemerythrin superfamily protein
MDAIVMLREDHKNVEKLFKALEKDDLSVVPQICEELTVHAQIEESIFYPAVRAEMEDSAEDIGEAVEEHHIVKVLIEELQAMAPDDEAYKSKATVLMELVRHHVDEEESELFPEVRSELGRSRLQELGEQMEQERAALMGQNA